MSSLDVAERAKAAGASYSLRIVLEAKRVDLAVSLGFALVQHESEFRNVYGHDPVANRAPKGGAVTKRNYLGVYLPDRKAGKGSQGVGPCQLTYFAFQDRADRLGGCWITRHNIRVAFEDLATQIKTHGSLRAGLRAYNGTGPDAERYAASVLHLRDHWHKVLE